MDKIDKQYDDPQQSTALNQRILAAYRSLSSVGRKRALTYLALFGVLFYGVLFLAYLQPTWVGDKQLHTLIETVAGHLGFTVGVLALVRFYSKKNNTFLFIGTGFIGTGLLDAYHALVTSSYLADYLPSGLPSLIPWSWVASRIFLSILLFFSWFAWRRERDLGEEGRISERDVYLIAGGLTLISFLFFTFVPLPPAYYPDLYFDRPQEFVPAFFFTLALIGYLRKGTWKEDSFEHWLVIALIVSVMGQTVYMPFAFQNFDVNFDAAHHLKNVSYLCVLVGLLINMYSTFQREQENAHQLQQRTAEFEAIFRSIPDAVTFMDLDRHIIRTNPAFSFLFGFEGAEIGGKQIEILYVDPQGFQEQAFNEEGEPISEPIELSSQRQDGSVFVSETVSTAVRNVQDQSVGLLTIIRDITDRKKGQKVLEDYNRTLEQDVKQRTGEVGRASRQITELNKRLRVENRRLGEQLEETRKLRVELTDARQEAERMRQQAEQARQQQQVEVVQEEVAAERAAEVVIKEVVEGVSDEAGTSELPQAVELDVTRQLQQLLLPTAAELRHIQGLEVAGSLNGQVDGDFYNQLLQHGQLQIGIGSSTLQNGTLMFMTAKVVRNLLISEEEEQTRFLNLLTRTIDDNVQRLEKGLPLAILNLNRDDPLAAFGQGEQILVVRQGGQVRLVDSTDLGFPTDPDSGDLMQFEAVEGLVLFSAAINEAADLIGEHYDLEQLRAVVKRHWQKSAEAITRAVMRDLSRTTHIMADDISLLVLKQK